MRTDGPQAMLLDIEGTTTALSYVTDVLFPYARDRMETALAEVGPDSRLAPAVARLREEWRADREAHRSIPEFGTGSRYALALMDEDRKSTGLKELQGLLWETGYLDGSLRAHVFDDVPGALATWSSRGLGVYIFSSGSVHAQKLLFAHTLFGDLSKSIAGYFDTTIGPKTDPRAYERIGQRIGLPTSAILFLSDRVPELEAAAEANLQTGLMHRPGNPAVDRADCPRYPSFAMVPTGMQ